MGQLSFENVGYIYGVGTPEPVTALDDVSLTFAPGAVTGLIGHTGSGKSTLIQLANGILKPTSGRVLLDGADIWAEPKKIRSVRFRVGLVFQYPEYQLFEDTVYGDIAFGPGNMGLNHKETDRRIRRAAEFVGLDPSLFDRSPFELSGGQKRRVAIAGIFAMEPEILILDEPAAGLDPAGREEILGGIRDYQKKTGNTVIIVSHSMEDIARYADELVVLDHGKVFRRGSCAEVFGDGDGLRSVGLEVPSVTRIIEMLRKRGLPLRDGIYTVEDAAAEIARLRTAGKDAGTGVSDR